MSSNYAWLITRDHLAEPGWPSGDMANNAKDINGPSDATLDQLERLHAMVKRGRKNKLPDDHWFKMYDDDGELYYTGVFLGDPDSEDGFGPLEDFGTPNAGAVEICYYKGKVNGKEIWETL
jgi:hypothetical protein